jgi:hypothetical protein
MATTLDTQLDALASRVRRLVWMRGLSASVAVFVGSLALAGLLDWALHLDDVGLRVLLAFGAVTATVVVIWKRLVLPLRRPITTADVALRLEEHFPELRDGLASVVQFVGERFHTKSGSPALQRLAAERAEQVLAGLPVDEVIESRPVCRMAWAAVAICLVAVMLMLVNQAATWVALQRLLLPWSAPAWPRQVNLRVLSTEWEPLEAAADDVPRIALGDEYRVLVENQTGRLPSRVTLELLADNATEPRKEPLRVIKLRDNSDQNREVASVLFRAVAGRTRFRVTAGDDRTMPWYEVQAVPVPRLEAVQVRIIPPKYTGLPPRDLPEGLGDIEAWLGSRLELRGRSSRPIQAAAIRIKNGDPLSATVNENGRDFEVAWQATEVGASTYAIELKDLEGFEPAEVPRYEFRVLADQTPEVTLEQPAVDLQVTPTAVVRVEYVARDDLGLARSELVWQRDGGAPVRVPLWSFRASADAASSVPGDAERTYAGEYEWDLGSQGWPAGAVIAFWLEVVDGAEPPHVGRSVTRTVRVVSPEQKTLELAARQAQLLEQIERTAKQQAVVREQTRQLEIQAEQSGQLRPEDLADLQRLEVTQRQIAAQIAGQVDSLDRKLTETLGEFEANQLGDDPSAERLEAMADEVDRLRRDTLPGIDQSLTRARKAAELRDARASADSEAPDSAANEPAADAAQPDLDPKPGSTAQTDSKPGKSDPEVAARGEESPAPNQTAPQANEESRSLAEAARRQAEVGESLGELAQKLARWRDERDAAQQVGQLAADQDELTAATEQLGQRLIGKPVEDLDAQERADLAKLVEQQRQLGEREEQLERQLAGAAERLAGDDPQGAQALKDTLESLRTAGAAEKMREATERLAENRTAAAGELQRAVADALGQIERGDSSETTPEAEELVRREKEIEQQLDALLAQQEQLQKRTEAANQLEDPAARADELQKIGADQRALREAIEQASRELQRLGKQGPAERLAEAAARLEKLRTAEAGQPADAAGQAEVLDDLRQARQELAQERAEDEARLAFEQLVQIRDDLAGLLARQQAATVEFDRIRTLVTPEKRWTRPLLASLRALGQAETRLSDDLLGLAQKIAAAQVFSLTLESIARQQREIAERLSERDLGDEPRAQAVRIEARLRELLELIAQRGANGGQGGAGQGPGQAAPPPAGEENPTGPTQDAISLLAEFKLLRSLQREVADRTEALLARSSGERPAQELPAQEPVDGEPVEQELAELREEQVQLADLARNLMINLKELVETDDSEPLADEEMPQSPAPPEEKDNPDDPK